MLIKYYANYAIFDFKIKIMINPKDIKSDTIEKVICIPFHQLVKSNKGEQMSNELTEIMILLTLKKEKYLNLIPEEEKPFLWKVMEKRMKAYHTSLRLASL